MSLGNDRNNIGGRLGLFKSGPRGPAYSARVSAFISACAANGVTLDSTMINALVNTDNYLVANSDLNNAIAYYRPYVGNAAGSNKLNFMNVATFVGIYGGGVTHSDGVTFNGTNGYERTGFNPSVDLSSNDGGFCYYAGVYTDNNGIAAGAASGTTGIRTYPNLSGLNRTYYYINDATDTFISNSDTSGFFGFHREGGTKYRDIRGTKSNVAVAAVGLANAEFCHGCVGYDDGNRYSFSNIYMKGFLQFNGNIDVSIMDKAKILLDNLQADLGRTN